MVEAVLSFRERKSLQSLGKTRKTQRRNKSVFVVGGAVEGYGLDRMPGKLLLTLQSQKHALLAWGCKHSWG